MCEYIYYRYVSSKCAEQPTPHKQRFPIYFNCPPKRGTGQACPIRLCTYRADLDPFGLIPTDELCQDCLEYGLCRNYGVVKNMEKETAQHREEMAAAEHVEEADDEESSGELTMREEEDEDDEEEDEDDEEEDENEEEEETSSQATLQTSSMVHETTSDNETCDVEMTDDDYVSDETLPYTEDEFSSDEEEDDE